MSTTTVYGSYQMNDAVEFVLAVSDTDGEQTTGLGVDYDDDRLDLSGFILESDGETTFAIDANYDFGNNFRVLGGYIDFDGFVDVISVGAGYQVSQDLWLDASIGRVDGLSADTIDTIGIALTYEMGRETMLFNRAATAQTNALGSLGGLVGSF